MQNRSHISEKKTKFEIRTLEGVKFQDYILGFVIFEDRDSADDAVKV